MIALSRRTLLSCVIALVLAPAPRVGAHDDVHLSGTIEQVTLTGLSVKGKSGRATSVALTPSTTVTKDGRKASVLDLKVGMRVEVDAHEDEAGALAAEAVRILPAAPK